MLDGVDQPRLNRIAVRQHGLFTRADARTCGYSDYQVRHRLATGEWQRVLGPVLAYRGLEIICAVRDRAAYLAAAPRPRHGSGGAPGPAGYGGRGGTGPAGRGSSVGRVLAGPSAARAWGMPVEDERVALLVHPHSSLSLPGVLLLRGQPGPRQVVRLDGLAATTRDRTVFDCLRLSEEDAGRRFLDHALQREWVTVATMIDLLHASVGRRGIDRARRVLAGMAGGERSAAERRLTSLLRAALIGGWQANRAIRDNDGVIGVGDVVFPRERLVVEVDGWAFHRGLESFQADRVRQNRLMAAGWRVLRFTWRDLTSRPAAVIATIHALLGLAATPR